MMTLMLKQVLTALLLMLKQGLIKIKPSLAHCFKKTVHLCHLWILKVSKLFLRRKFSKKILTSLSPSLLLFMMRNKSLRRYFILSTHHRGNLTLHMALLQIRRLIITPIKRLQHSKTRKIWLYICICPRNKRKNLSSRRTRI